MQEHIIKRTEKISNIRDELKTSQILYISSFFYSGKTILLDQLYEAIEADIKACGPDKSIINEQKGVIPEAVLRFDAETDDIKEFMDAVSVHKSALLLIDSLHLVKEETMQEIAALICNLPETAQAVLCGRAKMPDKLERLCANGMIKILSTDFVLFSADEISELFLTYNVTLRHNDIAYLKNQTWGWVPVLKGIAEHVHKCPQIPVSSMQSSISVQFGQLFIRDVLSGLPAAEQKLLYRLSPFEHFDNEFARTITELPDAPELMESLSSRSYILMNRDPDSYYFIPFIQDALLREVNKKFAPDRIKAVYERAGRYFRLKGDLPEAAEMYIKANDLKKITELLIENSAKRPSNGDYAELINAFSVLPSDTIKHHPELMKGKCIAESLKCFPAESDRWYNELKIFAQNAPKGSPERKTAEEALAYLDICLPQKGTSNILQLLIKTAKRSVFTKSRSWSGGFNIAGNSVSLMNGGKDFCRWVPKGAEIYRRFRVPVEMALGLSGKGLADIAIAECELESRLDGNYTNALNSVNIGLSRISGDLEMKCAAIGIQSRILLAQGNPAEALSLIESTIARLPADAPRRLRENLEVYRLDIMLMTGDNSEALNWLENEAPDEAKDFVILDRYRYILKLRLYIILGRWDKTIYLAAKLRSYFDMYDRPYLRIKLHLLEAKIYHSEHNDTWKDEFRSAIALARKYKLVRAIADEGMGIIDMMTDIGLPDGEWEKAVLALTRTQAVNYPAYMDVNAERPEFTEKERQTYVLLCKGYRNAKIARILGLTERTVKYRILDIYKKLGVESRAEAIAKAIELGDIR